MSEVNVGTVLDTVSGKHAILTQTVSNTKSLIIPLTTLFGLGTDYVANDTLSGKLTLTGISGLVGQACTIMSVLITDKVKVNQGMQLIFFNANPATSTFTNGAAMSITPADIAKVVGVVEILSTDYIEVGATSFVQKVVGGLQISPAAGVDMYAALLCVDGGLYTSATDLTLTINVQQ